MTRIGNMCAAGALVISASSAAAQTTMQAAQQAFQDDVHAAAGLACDACHQRTTPSYAPIARSTIAPLCAKCHSDPAYMRRFSPQLRIDQYAQYLTSTHGKQMSAGETRVATCSDCHGAHGIRKDSDVRSTVAPVNVARTCANCHADPVRMAPFSREPDSFEDWSSSVHARALLKQGDLSAPTCSTCHGSHGATPPGVTEVANVCAQCHVRESELFRGSPKKAIFDDIGQAECLACHGNHRIESPTDSWIGLNEPAVCATCHDETMKGAQATVEVREELDQLSVAIAAADALLARAERAGMLVDDGRAAWREAREHQIHSRVLVHAFVTKPFSDKAHQGLRSAWQAQAVGHRALRELQVRRRGLFVTTIIIVGFLVTLAFKIRQLPT